MSKQAVYHAEFNLRDMLAGTRTATIAGTTLTMPDEYRFGDLSHVQTYIDHVLRVVSDVYPAPPCTVREGNRNLRKHAYHQGNEIVLPQRDVTTWAWREIVVLHEIAHHLTPGHGHDAVFAGCMKYLLTLMVGEEVGFAYGVLLAHEGITPTQRMETASV